MLSTETQYLINEVKNTTGLNVYASLAIFKKRSKLKPDIPEKVIQSVCMEYLSRQDSIRKDFPYFLTVLQRKSEAHFSKENELEGKRLKKQKLAIGNIMKEIYESSEKTR